MIYIGAFFAIMATANLLAAFFFGMRGELISLLFSLNALATGVPVQLRIFG